MADITGSVSRNSGRFTYYLRCTEQDISDGVDNRSKVRVGIRIASSGSSLWASRYASATHTITINGVSYIATSEAYDLRGGQDIEIAAVVSEDWIYHEDDGSKIIRISANSPDLAQGNGYGPYSGSASGDMTLTTIPRYANITSFSEQSKTLNTITVQYSVDSNIDNVQYQFEGGSWNNMPSNNTITGLQDNTAYKIRIRVRRTDSQLWTESNYITITTYRRATFTSVPNVNIGDSQTIAWENPSGATTSIKLYQDDYETVIEDLGIVTSTSLTYTATASDIYALTPNSNEYNARYVITTTQNGETYTSNGDFKFIVTNSNPIFNDFAYSSSNKIQLTGVSTRLIKNYSIFRVTISASNRAEAQNGATIEKYQLVSGNINVTQDNTPSGRITINTSQVIDNNTITVYAIDSRGNSTAVTKVLSENFIDYTDLTIQGFNAERQNNGVGESTTITFQGTFWNNDFGAVVNHIKTVTYEYKYTNSQTWTTGTTTINVTENSDGTYTFSGLIAGDLGANGFDESKSFNMRLTVKDELSTRTSTFTLGAGTPAIAISDDNKVAIGQKYDTTLGGGLQVKGQIYMNGQPIGTGGGVGGETLPVGSEIDFAGQVSDIPTGWEQVDDVYGIVDSGNNTNGSYIKYGNGTMICYATKSFTLNINGQYEGIYYANFDDISFPINFISTPTITLGTSLGLAGGVSMYNPDATGFGGFVWKVQAKTSQTVAINYVAIGRWK